MLTKLAAFIVRNLFRSKTRLVVTTLGCTVAAFVTCFFVAAEKSLDSLTDSANQDANVIVRQKDRY
jgi:hypothetical protein